MYIHRAHTSAKKPICFDMKILKLLLCSISSISIGCGSTLYVRCLWATLTFLAMISFSITVVTIRENRMGYWLALLSEVMPHELSICIHNFPLVKYLSSNAQILKRPAYYYAVYIWFCCSDYALC